MAKRASVALVLVLVLVAGGLPALAIAQPAPTTDPPAAPPPVSATATPPATATPAASGSAAPPPAVPPRPAAGYGWTSVAARAPQGGARRLPSGPLAVFPGFEELADGSSKLFVELTKVVPVVEEKGVPGHLTYVLKGTHVDVWNNSNALVTSHFNTPVNRARLVQHGGDLHFVVDLRANVAPTWTITQVREGEGLLEIVFPQGNYARPEVDEDGRSPGAEWRFRGAAAAASASTAAPAPSRPMMPRGGGGRRQRGSSGTSVPE